MVGVGEFDVRGFGGLNGDFVARFESPFRGARPRGAKLPKSTRLSPGDAQWWSCPAIRYAFGDPSPVASSYPVRALQHETLVNTELVPVVMSR
jgi:hypothetical protein